MLNRLAFLRGFAPGLIVGLVIVALVRAALAAPDVPPPPMQRPVLVDVSPSGRQSAWYYHDWPGSECREALPGLAVPQGALTSLVCVETDDRPLYTFVVEGVPRETRWRGEVLESVGGVVYLPVVR